MKKFNAGDKVLISTNKCNYEIGYIRYGPYFSKDRYVVTVIRYNEENTPYIISRECNEIDISLYIEDIEDQKDISKDDLNNMTYI